MSYKEEQESIRREIEVLDGQIAALEKLFNANPSAKKYSRSHDSFGYDNPFGGVRRDEQDKYALRCMAYQYGIPYNNESVLYLRYKILVKQRDRYRIKLRESETSRNIDKALDFVDSIIPEHVSGRVYRVKNIDSCLLAWVVYAIFGLIFLMMIGIL